MRFEVFFERHLCRKAAEQYRQERDMLKMAINSNPNWDMKENAEARGERLRVIDQSYKQAVEIIYGDGEQTGVADQQIENDPLFRSMRDSAVDMRSAITTPSMPEEGMGAALLEAAR